MDFNTRSGSNQSCSFLSFVFNFGVVMGMTLTFFETNDTDIFSDRNFSDFEYAGDVLLLSQAASILYVFLDRLDDSVGMFNMRFAPPKCKMPFQDVIDSKPDRFLAGEQIGELDRFNCLGSCTSHGDVQRVECCHASRMPDWHSSVWDIRLRSEVEYSLRQ